MQQKVAPIQPDLEQQLTQVILTSQSPQSALSDIARLIAKTFQVEGCVILPQPKAIAQASSWFAPQIESNRVVQQLMTLLTAGAPNWAVTECWETEVPSEASLGVPERLVVVPTRFQGQINGAIALIRSQLPALHQPDLQHPSIQPPAAQEWNESTMSVLQSLSSRVAIAISQAQLDQQLQQQVRYQTLIDRLTTSIRNAWELDEIFKLAVEGTAASLNVNRGLLLLFKYADPLHKTRNLEGIPKTRATVAAEWLKGDQDQPSFSAVTDHPPFVASDCRICQQVLRGNLEPIVIPVSEILVDLNLADLDLTSFGSEDSAFSPAIAPLFQLTYNHAILLTPLENQGTVLGCLVLHHNQPRLWSIEELSFVKLAAAQLSTAIIQTRTLKQIQGVVQERTAQLQRSLDVQAKLYEKSRQQVEQLRRLNQEREEFLSTVSHELRTPLTSMMLAIRMLRQADLTPDRQKKYLNILEQQCVQETNLINDMLALRKLETNQATNQLQKTDLRYLIRGTTQSIESTWVEKGLILSLILPNDPVMLYTDTDSLNRVLLELLTNAGKYAEPGSTVELKLVHEANPPHSQVVLSLRNVGDGILPEELPHIFEKFRRGQGITKRAIQGTGLGLALVKGLVDHLNGAIAATSQPISADTWQTCFTLTLPQCPEGAIAAVGAISP
jgi:signal transduction histidine kinase